MYNTEKFIKIADNIHKNKYDYSLVDYINSKTRVKIICHIHGIFEQKPVSHLRGRGCPFCGGSLKKNKDDFIKKSKLIHGDKYDYSLVEYKSSIDKVKIICPTHGSFYQQAYNHTKGHGCVKCMGEKSKKTNDEFIKESKLIHGDKYDYSLVDYIDSKTKVKIICKLHGVFEQTPRNHLSGQGCRECKINDSKLNLFDFIRRSNIIHDFYYDYNKVQYINNYTKVIIICPKHGEFQQIPNFHLLGQGCPSCKKSIMENKISELLKSKNVIFNRQKIFEKCKNINYLPFDFFLPEYNLVIEYNGKQHYEPIKWFGGEETLFYIKNNDEIKKKFCIENNINYVEISYKENNKIKNIIDGILL